MLPLRFVLDTNVIVSGALNPIGLERTALTVALTAPARLYVSDEILAEYREVIARPALHINAEEQERLIHMIANRSYLVRRTVEITFCPDPDDDIFLECADACRADYLVTGNKRHFPAFWKSTKVVNSRELMAIIAPHLRR